MDPQIRAFAYNKLNWVTIATFILFKSEFFGIILDKELKTLKGVELAITSDTYVKGTRVSCLKATQFEI